MNPDRQSPPILAAPLRPGDTIGLVCPAGPVRDRAAFAKGCTILSDCGFRLQPFVPRDAAVPYLAADDDQRLAEFHAAWANPRLKAIMAARGGYGCLRLLPHLDYGFLARHPKFLLGFSDISALHSAIGRQTGIITLHGPVVTSLARADRQTVQAMIAALTTSQLPAIKIDKLEILAAGSAHGRLCGGNLTTLCHLLGTPQAPDFTDGLVILEEIGEAPYRIDRMLTQLFQAGSFAATRGIMLGRFLECGDEQLIWQRVLELFAPFNIPIWANLPIGHGSQNITLPLGCMAAMDGSQGCLIPLSPHARNT